MKSEAPRSSTDLGLAISAFMALLAGVTWISGALASFLTGHGFPHGHPAAGLGAFAHFSNPSIAWNRPVGPIAIYWAFNVVGIGIAVGIAIYIKRFFDTSVPMRRPIASPNLVGLASRKEISRAAGKNMLVAKSNTLRPSLTKAKPSDLGYKLGTSRNIQCWVSVEDSMLLLGPPRSGKGMNFVIPMILDSPGAVVTTSTRPDNLAITLANRNNRGPVAIFDPQGLAGPPNKTSNLRWSLVRGCENPQTAMVRAQALVVEGAKSGVENGNFWRQQALSVTRCLLHAAALDGKNASDLYRWSHSAPGTKEAVSILTSHPLATPGWAKALDAVIGADQRTRDSVWAMVANTFSPLADPKVLAAVSPLQEEEFDPLAFLALHGTLFLLGTSSGASASASLVAALIEDIIDAGRKLAALSPNQRLDPPLALILDEAANYPLPSLPQLMSEGGGSGITTLAVLQSLAQARDQWGKEAASTIWDSAIVKIVLGGSANAEDLRDISHLIGDRPSQEWSQTVHGSEANRSLTSSTQWRPILEPSEIRRLPIGLGLLLLRSAPPIIMNLSPWTKRQDALLLSESRKQWERGKFSNA